MSQQAKKLFVSGGFEGAISGLPLTDVLQLMQQNRFTGSLRVRRDAEEGQLFFREGRLFHAALGRLSGDQACYQMLNWESGCFEVETKITTTSNSIDKPLNFLLLEACRQQDETPEDVVNDEVSTPPQAKITHVEKMLTALRKLPQVLEVLVVDRNGRKQDSQMESEEGLATDGEFLAMTGRRFGQLLGVGDLKVSSLLAEKHQIVSLHNSSRSLHLSFVPGDSFQSRLTAINTQLKELEQS